MVVFSANFLNLNIEFTYVFLMCDCTIDMRRVFWFLLVFLVGVNSVKAVDKPKIINGVLDLRGGGLEQFAEIDFTGEWELYWQQFVDYDDFLSDSSLEPTTLITVPEVWNTASVDGELIPAHGYATYRIRVFIDNTEEPLAIKFGSISSAFKVFINDKYIRGAGVIATNAEDAVPGYSTGVSIFQAPADTFDIIIQVSNFHYCKGGVWNNITTIGKAEEIQSSWQNAMELLLLLLGCIVIIGFYYLGIYHLNRSFRSAIFFTMFCVVIGVRAVSINEIYLLKLIPTFSWVLLAKLEYLTLNLGTIIFVLLIEEILPKFRLKRFSLVVYALNAVSVLVIVLTSVNFFSSLLIYFQIALLLGCGYALYLAIRASVKGERLAQILIVGMLVLVVAVLNDMLYVNRVIYTTYLTTYGFMFFVLSQAYMLSYQFQRMFYETKKLADDLEHINQNLEKTVELRTQEIQSQNNKLLEQNEEITAQRDNIEKQHTIVKKQKQVITDSINYAQRIQHAVLPSDNKFAGHLKDFFILYKPRDIVSGDFYWFTSRENKVIIVVADCTGHGVPGAFMSMLGMAFLAEVSRMSEVTSPADMLEFMREKVKQSLHQYDERSLQKEGMDMSLCVYNKDTQTIEYAGAYSPLYIIRNNDVIVYKGDRQPVAVYLKERAFTNNTIKVEQGDRFYMFSDGYADQVAEGSLKKFMPKNFRNLLLENHQLPMEEQKEKLEKTLSEWKGQGAQIDDILVMGFEL